MENSHSLFTIEQQTNGPSRAERLIRTSKAARECYREFYYQAYSPFSWQVEVNGDWVAYDHRELSGFTESGLLFDLRRVSGPGREKPTENFHLLVADLRTGQTEAAYIDWLEEVPDGDGARLNMIASLTAGAGALHPRAFELSTSRCQTYTEQDAHPEAIGQIMELEYRLVRAGMAQ